MRTLQNCQTNIIVILIVLYGSFGFTFGKQERSAMPSRKSTNIYFLDDYSKDVRKNILLLLKDEVGISKDAKNLNIVILDDQILIRGRVKDLNEMNKIISIVSDAEPNFYISNEMTVR